MKITIPLFLIFTLATLSGCSNMKVTSEHDSSFNFSQVTTYQWVDAPSNILDEDNTYLNADLHNALNNELSARGWQETLNSTNASIQVVYYIKLQEHQEYTTGPTDEERDFSGGFVYNRDQSNWGYEEREPDLNFYTVEIGTLTVLAYNAQNGNRIWRGSLQTKLDRARPIEKQQKLLRDVSRKLVEQIPAGN